MESGELYVGVFFPELFDPGSLLLVEGPDVFDHLPGDHLGAPFGGIRKCSVTNEEPFDGPPNAKKSWQIKVDALVCF